MKLFFFVLNFGFQYALHLFIISNRLMLMILSLLLRSFSNHIRFKRALFHLLLDFDLLPIIFLLFIFLLNFKETFANVNFACFLLTGTPFIWVLSGFAINRRTESTILKFIFYSFLLKLLILLSLDFLLIKFFPNLLLLSLRNLWTITYT